MGAYQRQRSEHTRRKEGPRERAFGETSRRVKVIGRLSGATRDTSSWRRSHGFVSADNSAVTNGSPRLIDSS
jgi:hypothetical protein